MITHCGDTRGWKGNIVSSPFSKKAEQRRNCLRTHSIECYLGNKRFGSSHEGRWSAKLVSTRRSDAKDTLFLSAFDRHGPSCILLLQTSTIPYSGYLFHPCSFIASQSQPKHWCVIVSDVPVLSDFVKERLDLPESVLRVIQTKLVELDKDLARFPNACQKMDPSSRKL